MIRLLAFLLFWVACLFPPARARAGFILGPGDVPATSGDQASNLIAVDLNKPILLDAGNYTASSFNYQFTDFSGYTTKGTITPLLLVGGGGTFSPLAIGESVTYSGATAFQSTLFGGSPDFTLGTATNVYAGLYWQATDSGPLELRMPVGYANLGSSFVVFGGGTGAGANSPVLDQPISGTGEGTFQRTYDFSVGVDPIAAPEPSTLVLGMISLGVGGCWHTLRRRRLARSTSTLPPAANPDYHLENQPGRVATIGFRPPTPD